MLFDVRMKTFINVSSFGFLSTALQKNKAGSFWEKLYYDPLIGGIIVGTKSRL
jgi:hypothetical protein